MRLLIPLLLLAVAVGCYGSNLPADLPRLYPCTITVIQDGNPLAGATIILQTVEGTAPAAGQIWFPTGVTDENGETIIMTNSRYAGAPLGHYKILVSKPVAGESRHGPPPPEDDPRYDRWSALVGAEELPIYELVDKQFTEAQTTPHEIEITRGRNSATIDVGKAVRDRQPF